MDVITSYVRGEMLRKNKEGFGLLFFKENWVYGNIERMEAWVERKTMLVVICYNPCWRIELSKLLKLEGSKGHK